MNDLNALQAEMPLISKFVSKPQIIAIALGANSGEERQYFIDKGLEMAETFKTMPKTYEQDGKGDEAIVYLHYFLGGAEWFITEKDMEDEQHQAFGLADLGMGYPELGYISIAELIGLGAEIDLHWTPKTLAAVKASRA